MVQDLHFNIRFSDLGGNFEQIIGSLYGEHGRDS